MPVQSVALSSRFGDFDQLVREVRGEKPLIVAPKDLERDPILGLIQATQLNVHTGLTQGTSEDSYTG